METAVFEGQPTAAVKARKDKKQTKLEARVFSLVSFRFEAACEDLENAKASVKSYKSRQGLIIFRRCHALWGLRPRTKEESRSKEGCRGSQEGTG